MTGIERTAYPRFKKNKPISKKDLDSVYCPTEKEIDFVNQFIKGNNPAYKFHH